MKNKILGLFIILTIILIPSNAFASGYSGIDTELQIGNTAAAQSSVGFTNRIVGTLQVAGTIIAVISLIIIGMRYMFSSVQDRAQMKGVIGYWIIGAILVLCTSNVLAFVYDIIDDVQHEYEDVPASEGGIKLAPTCVEPGIQLRKCKDCGKTIEVTIPMVSPDEYHKNGDYLNYTYTAETCTTEGLKVWRCTLGCTYYDDEIVQKLGHHFEYGVIKPPTCTESGYQGDKCQRCGFEKDTSILVATEHSYVIEDTTSAYLKSPATCTAKAEYYYKCSGCTEKGTTTFEFGSELAHSYTITNDTSALNRATNATCTKQATYYKKCLCGAIHQDYTFSAGSMLAHSYTDTTDTTVQNRATKATCTQKATYYKKCACGAKGTETFQYGSLADHTYDIEDATATYLASNATCTAKARYYYKCSCGAIGTGTFAAGELVAHDWYQPKQEEATLASAATCQSGPMYYYECSYRCGTHDEGKTFESGTATGVHNYIIPDGFESRVWVDRHGDNYLRTPATCGYAATYWKECEWCGYSMKDYMGPLMNPEWFCFEYGEPLGGCKYDCDGKCKNCGKSK